jgi:hypothetical protein
MDSSFIVNTILFVLVFVTGILVYSRSKELYINEKLPVTSDTLEYIKENTPNPIATRYFDRLESIDKKVSLNKIQGTLLDVPKVHSVYSA